MPSVPEEHFGVYKFEFGEKTYTYRTENQREYTNDEFMNILCTSQLNSMYYDEPCTMWNDLDGDLKANPRNKDNDEVFLSNVRVILLHTDCEKKKQLINKILNECFIVDEEPVLKDGCQLGDKEIYFDKSERFGKYHIDIHKLKNIYRDSINMSAHKYIKKFYSDQHYDKTEEKNIDLLLKVN